MSYKNDLVNYGKRIIYEDLASNYSVFDNLGKIGVFGDLSFRVNDNYILTPTGSINEEKGLSVHKHEGINAPDVSEFKKRNLKTVSFPIKAIYDYIDIKKITTKLNRMIDNGETYPLVIGGEVLADNPFILKTVSERTLKTDGYGTKVLVEYNLSFEEYIEEISRGNNVSVKMIKQENTILTDNKIIKDINKEIIKSLEDNKLW